jgi:YihY family inner membrane protein
MKSLVAKLDALQRRHPILGFTYGVIKKFGDDRGGQLAALITYYGFFSLFPVLLVAFTILGFVLQDNPQLQTDIAETLSKRLPLPGIEAGSIRGSGVALGVGLVLALWSGLSATQVAQDALNTVWNVQRADQANFLWKRLRGLLTLLVIGLGIVASTAVGAFVSVLGPAAQIGGYLGAVLVSTVVVTGLMMILVTDRPSWRDVLPGAVFVAIGWTVLQALGAWYTRGLIERADKTYGTFAIVIGLLSWIFLQSQIFVYGAELAVVRAHRLWPRSVDTDDQTDADRRLVELIHQREANR